MDEKVSVYVTVPGYYEKFNFLIPATMPVATAIKLICRLLKKTKQIPLDGKNAALLNLSTGLFLSASLTIQTAGLSNGTALLLTGGHYGRNQN